MIEKIISGGQTGADRAALDVGIELGIPHGGWIPKGRKTENGKLPDHYRMQETETISYPQRTELNVADSDATLIFSHGKLTGGSALTQKLARKHRQPCLHIDLSEMDDTKVVEVICRWIDTREIKTLNVAGARASKDPKIYDATKGVLSAVIRHYLPQTVEEAVDRLMAELPLKYKTSLANMPEEEMSSLHVSLGVYIRKKSGLWSGNQKLLDYCRALTGDKEIDADDVSAIIINQLWKQLRESHALRVVKGG